MTSKYGLSGLVAFSAFLLCAAILTPSTTLAQGKTNWRNNWKLKPVEIKTDVEEKKPTEVKYIPITNLLASPAKIEVEVTAKEAEKKSADFKTETDREVVVAKADGKKKKKKSKKEDSKKPEPKKKVEAKKPSSSSSRYRLGIMLSPLSDSTRSKYKIPEEVGYGIKYVVDGSAADKGGLKKSDIIVGLGNAPAKSYKTLVDAVQKAGQIKKTVELWVMRDGKKTKVSVKPEVSKRSSSHSHRGHSSSGRSHWGFRSYGSHSSAFSHMMRVKEHVMKMYNALDEKDQERARDLIAELRKLGEKAARNLAAKSGHSSKFGQFSDPKKRIEYFKKMMAERKKAFDSDSNKRAEFMKKMHERFRAIHGSHGKKCDKCTKDKKCDSCRHKEHDRHGGHHAHRGHDHHKGHGHHDKKCDKCSKDKKCDSCKRKEHDRHHGHQHGHKGHDDRHKGHPGPPPHGRPPGPPPEVAQKAFKLIGELVRNMDRLNDRIAALSKRIEELTEQIERHHDDDDDDDDDRPRRRKRKERKD